MLVSKKDTRPSGTGDPVVRFLDVARLLTSLLLALCVAGVSAPGLQGQTINGTLMEVETGQPISLGLVIMMTESGDSITSTVTDGQGRFSISSDEAGSFILMLSVLTVVGTLLSDLLLAWLDPRIRYR